tara:strand:- start:1653 stop:2006 length:354 start_codon:yes stop_codon:yes gene_type:complete
MINHVWIVIVRTILSVPMILTAQTQQVQATHIIVILMVFVRKLLKMIVKVALNVLPVRFVLEKRATKSVWLDHRTLVSVMKHTLALKENSVLQVNVHLFVVVILERLLALRAIIVKI